MSSPARRVILLGASNVTRSFPTIVATLRQTWSVPVEIMVAMGHGRSFGQDSAVLGRKIPGIFPCALWQDLQNRAELPTTALITDIGNDLLYGIAPDLLLDWVARCLDRLDSANAATIVTQLPIESIERLGERRFQLFRRLLFPRSQLTLAAAGAMAREMNERLLEMGHSRKISVIPVSGSWYGFDPIHLKWSTKPRAWSEIFASWRDANETFNVARPSLWSAAYLATLAPHERSFFGFTRRAPQPIGRFHDGTTISLY